MQANCRQWQQLGASQRAFIVLCSRAVLHLEQYVWCDSRYMSERRWRHHKKKIQTEKNSIRVISISKIPLLLPEKCKKKEKPTNNTVCRTNWAKKVRARVSWDTRDFSYIFFSVLNKYARHLEEASSSGMKRERMRVWNEPMKTFLWVLRRLFFVFFPFRFVVHLFICAVRDVPWHNQKTERARER